MKRLVFVFLFCCVTFFVHAQQTFTISGTVRDSVSREVLIGANVYLKENLKGQATNQKGTFQLQAKEGNYTIVCSFIGYKPFEKKIFLTKNLKFNILLPPHDFMTQVVEVKATREDQNIKSTAISTIELPMKRIQTIPVLFGETDILKTIQLLPDIQSGGEGSNTFYVRGGGSDQNLIMIDGATVYNPSHVAGFFSIFNADVINTADIYKGGLAPEYGGRMSSVLSITTLDGDKDAYSGNVGIGLIASHATVQGPIQKGLSSFMFSGRRTYADILMQPFVKNTDFSGVGCYFYDLNGKLTFQLSPKDHLFVSGYYGKDVFKYSLDTKTYGYDINWSNAIASVRWNHFFSNKLILNVGGHFTNYNLYMAGNEDVYDFKLQSNVRDWVGKTDLTWTPNALHKFKTGVSYTYHIFTPSVIQAQSLETDFDMGNPMCFYADDIAAFLQHEWEPAEWLKVLYGIRYNYFAQKGPFTRYTIDNVYDFNNLDSTYYGSGKVVQAYSLWEPRVNIRFNLAKDKSLKASYTLNQQCVNLSAMFDMSMPTDVWLPATELLKPQKSHQFTLGYFQNLFNNKVEVSLEAYYKKMYNLMEFKQNGNIINSIDSNIDYLFTSGEGQSYGAELFINKTVGNFTGWLGYTLSWTTRNFDEIMDGETFFARYDRRHDVSLMLNYNFQDKWDFSLVWVFSSGNASTIPNAFYIINGKLYSEMGEHNAWRMPDYHRMDISATWHLFNKKHTAGDLNFSVYNVYNRHNPFFVSYTAEGDLSAGQMQIKAYQMSIFPVLPSISFNLKIR